MRTVEMRDSDVVSQSTKYSINRVFAADFDFTVLEY